MDETTTCTAIRAEWWPLVENADAATGRIASIEVERDSSGAACIAIHTFVDGQGSLSSYYLDREQALVFASALLDAVVLQ